MNMNTARPFHYKGVFSNWYIFSPNSFFSRNCSACHIQFTLGASSLFLKPRNNPSLSSHFSFSSSSLWWLLFWLDHRCHTYLGSTIVIHSSFCMLVSISRSVPTYYNGILCLDRWCSWYDVYVVWAHPPCLSSNFFSILLYVYVYDVVVYIVRVPSL